MSDSELAHSNSFSLAPLLLTACSFHNQLRMVAGYQDPLLGMLVCFLFPGIIRRLFLPFSKPIVLSTYILLEECKQLNCSLFGTLGPMFFNGVMSIGREVDRLHLQSNRSLRCKSYLESTLDDVQARSIQDHFHERL